MDARAQDARQLMSDGQMLMDIFSFELIPSFKELILGGSCVEPRIPGSRLGAAWDRGATVKQRDMASRTKASSGATRSGRLFLSDCHLPEGIVVDAEAGHIYWTHWAWPSTTVGSSGPTLTAGIAGSLSREASRTRRNKSTSIRTAASLIGATAGEMRVMRANLDGSQVETLVETRHGDKDRRDQTRWCVGIHYRPKLRKIYWTKKPPTKGGRGRFADARFVQDGA